MELRAPSRPKASSCATPSSPSAGTGFVGSHTVAALVAGGHEVRLLVRAVQWVAPAVAPLDLQPGDRLGHDGGGRHRPGRGRPSGAGLPGGGPRRLGLLPSLDSRDAGRIRQVNVRVGAGAGQVGPPAGTSAACDAGVGPISAAQVLVSWSHPGRLRSEAAFAALAGVAPIACSSGQVQRHRLSRAGDRQLNRVLHTIVLARLRDDPATRLGRAQRPRNSAAQPQWLE